MDLSSVFLVLTGFPVHAGASELVSLDLSADGFGQFVAENDDARVFIGRSFRFDVVLDFFFEIVRGLRALGQNDARLDDLPAHFVGGGRDAAFEHVGEFHDDAFDFKRPDAVAGGLDYVVRAADIPVKSVLVAPRHVSRMIVAVVPHLGRAFGLVVVAEKEPAGDFFPTF